MNATRRAALAAPLAVLGAWPALAVEPVITGTATFRERMALPPGAALEVELLDVSRADAPAIRLAEARIAVMRQVPIPFALHVEPSRIEQGNAYAVAARLSVDGRVAFRSDTLHPVLGRGAGRDVEILLRRVASPEAGPELVGPTWVAEQIQGRRVAERLPSTITFTAEGRAHGTGGCNRFTGGFALEGRALRFGAMASTNMACEEAAMDQEQRFHAALAVVRGYRIAGGILHLTDAAGATLIRLSRAG